MAGGFRIGIDLGGTKIEAALIDPGGAMRDRRRIPTPIGDYDAEIAAVAGLVLAIERASTASTPRSGSAFPARSPRRPGL